MGFELELDQWGSDNEVDVGPKKRVTQGFDLELDVWGDE